MAFQFIQLSVADGIAVLAANRPDKLNAINRRLPEDLAAAMDQVGRDDAVRRVVITGAGDRFTGDHLTAGEALRVGLVNTMVPRDQRMDEVMAPARKPAFEGR